MSKIKKLYFFFIFLNQIINTINIENDYITDLFKIGLFEKKTLKIKKEVYHKINKTHQIFSSCRVCIKLIQILNKIIEAKKEKYVTVAIEDSLEIDLCDANIWNQYFNFNEFLYNEYIMYFCQNTLKRIKYDIEENIYELYNKKEELYKIVCGKINPICNIAIKDELKNTDKDKIRFIFNNYSKYLLQEKNFISKNGLPYKLVSINENNIKIINKEYFIIQSYIKVLYKNKVLINDFLNRKFRVIKIDKLENNVKELFLQMKEKDQITFIFLVEYCKNEIMPSYSILEIKIKIHKIVDNIKDIENSYYKNLIFDETKFLLNKFSCL